MTDNRIEIEEVSDGMQFIENADGTITFVSSGKTFRKIFELDPSKSKLIDGQLYELVIPEQEKLRLDTIAGLKAKYQRMETYISCLLKQGSISNKVADQLFSDLSHFRQFTRDNK